MTKTRDVDSERQIEHAIAPVLAAMGYEVVRIRLGGGRQTVLQVMIERTDRVPLTVDDCAAASRALSAKFENDNLPAADYALEVSSPGIDRPLVRLADFARFAGFEAKVEMSEPLEGRRRFPRPAAGRRRRVRSHDRGRSGRLTAIRRDSRGQARVDRRVDRGEPSGGAGVMADRDTAGLARLELLQVADAVAREKGIERELVLEAMEQAITHAGKRKYGQEHDIRTDIDRETGEIKLMRYLEVAEEIENEATQIAISEAQERNPAAQVGDYLADPLPPIDFGRIAAQTAKQVIVQKVREAERARQYEEYKDRVQEIANGLVKRTEYGGLTVDLGRAEAVIRREDLLPRESFRNGDRVRAYIYDVRREPRGPQIFMSRTHPNFMAKLFAQEVPEIYDGIIEIDAVARDPGSRAKIAVHSNDSSIDPVGACVGMRGSRVQAVVGELQGEKIDIIQWSPDPAAFIVNALAPAEVTKVVLDEEAKRIEVVVPDEQLSPCHRPARAERAARLQPHGLGHRHPDRGRGIGAPPGGVPHALRDVHEGARRGRGDRPPARDGGLLHRGRGGLRADRGAGGDRGLRGGAGDRAGRAGRGSRRSDEPGAERAPDRARRQRRGGGHRGPGSGDPRRSRRE